MKTQRQKCEQKIDAQKVMMAAKDKQIQQLKQQNAELRAMDTIQQHRTKQLGKRSKPAMSQSEMKLEEAVAIVVGKRRRTSTQQYQLPSLSELRREEKAHISVIVKQCRPELAQFRDIMRSALAGAEKTVLKNLVNTPDFTDGFLLLKGHCASGWTLQRFLIEQGLDVK